MEVLLVMAAPFIFFIFVVLHYYRNTEAYRAEAMSDPLAKLEGVKEALTQQDTGQDGMRLFGERLVGTVDPLIYEMTPNVIPYAGFERFGSILWVYVPYFLYRDRPVMVGGKYIGEIYLGRELIRTSIGSSLVGDWYRRFGWPGIVIGMGVVGLLVSGYLHIVVSGVRKQRLWAISLWLLVSTVITKDANMTFLSGLWVALYDLPKHAVLLWMVMVGGKWILGLLRGRKRRSEIMSSAVMIPGE